MFQIKYWVHEPISPKYFASHSKWHFVRNLNKYLLKTDAVGTLPVPSLPTYLASTLYPIPNLIMELFKAQEMKVSLHAQSWTEVLDILGKLICFWLMNKHILDFYFNERCGMKTREVFCCFDKIPNKSNVRKEWFVWLTIWGQGIMVAGDNCMVGDVYKGKRV